MVSLTTTQRDLLHLLLTTELPIGASAIGQQLRVSPRQVHYSLREIKTWLDRRHTTLQHTPGVGIQVICSPDQKRRLLIELGSQAKFQLILTPGQRQQLLALHLLAAHGPLTLSQIQTDIAVSRATALKDLDTVETWLASFGLPISRRQHRGCWVEGLELARRQALAALLWGDEPFDWPIMAVRHGEGIVFALAKDAALLPSIAAIDTLVRGWDVQAALAQLAWAEAELGGRFTDEAVLHLSLAFAIQGQRVRAGHWASCDAEALQWLRAQATWPVADVMAAQLWRDLPGVARAAETAIIAMYLLCGARDEPWRHDLGADTEFRMLIDILVKQAAAAYAAPDLVHDRLLREGLEAHILPACVRQRFALWAPPRGATDTQTDRYSVERGIAQQLADTVASHTGIVLPIDAHDEIVLLLRAAFIRARPERARQVLVVCPSGIATTQLLVARLRARLPRLGAFEVLSLRDLNAERIAFADLIITTVPLVLPDATTVSVIQVHPMLKPEDIAALTQWMG
jgi:mannitol operon transcriptional antiterminator